MFCWYQEPEFNLIQLTIHTINQHNPQPYKNMNIVYHQLIEAPDLGKTDVELAQKAQRMQMDRLLQ